MSLIRMEWMLEESGVLKKERLNEWRRAYQLSEQTYDWQKGVYDVAEIEMVNWDDHILFTMDEESGAPH